LKDRVLTPNARHASPIPRTQPETEEGEEAADEVGRLSTVPGLSRAT
jgi:hypothetical protein